MAGSQITCTCGLVTPVPSLSQLRVQSGETAYRKSLPEVIFEQIESGELPGHACVECHQSTNEQWEGTVECERPYVASGDRSFLTILLHVARFAVIPFIFVIWLLWRSRHDDDISHGHYVAVNVVLRLCPACRQKLGRQTRRRMTRLLKKVPIYQQLLKEYPDATILPA